VARVAELPRPLAADVGHVGGPHRAGGELGF
jgi:hypothetical protein